MKYLRGVFLRHCKCTCLEASQWVPQYLSLHLFLRIIVHIHNGYWVVLSISIFLLPTFNTKYFTMNCFVDIEIVFWNILFFHHNPWHLPLLAQPGPLREAIHCAFLSSFICASILIATCLLLAASLAAGVIRPTLAKVHMACALTAHVETRRRYCPTMVPRRCSDSCLPVERQIWATLASAQVWTSAWRSSEPSPQSLSLYLYIYSFGSIFTM